MGCGTSKLEHRFNVTLLSFQTTENKEEFTIKDLASEELMTTDETATFSLIKLILSCKEKPFLDYFETDESIKDCIFCLFYEDKKLKKRFITYKDANKYNPYKQVRDHLGETITKVYVFNLKEHHEMNLTFEAIRVQLDPETDIIGKTVKEMEIENPEANADQKADKNDGDDDIEGETYEDDKEIEGNIMY
jgi:hypothetical protein